MMDIIGYCYILRHTIFNATKLNYQHFHWFREIKVYGFIILLDFCFLYFMFYFMLLLFAIFLYYFRFCIIISFSLTSNLHNFFVL